MLRRLHRKLHELSSPISLHLLPSPITRFLSCSSSSAANPALVLGALREHGIPDDLAQSVASKCPHILALRPDSTIIPKLAFLRSEGFSGPEVAEIILHNPSLLSRSLERSLAPSVAFLRSILPSKDSLLRVLKYTNTPLTPAILPNIAVLRDHGVPEAVVLKLLLLRPRSLMRDAADFVDALEHLRKLGLRPTGSNFVNAVGMLTYMSRSTFRRKVELYRELGWSEEEVLAMFRRQPSTLGLSDRAIREKVGRFAGTMGWGPEFLCKYPSILMMSLEKRIAPRCAALNVLMSKGLLRRNARPARTFYLAEAAFVKKYVKKYEEMEPGVAMALKGKIEFRGWDWLKKDSKIQPEAT